MNESPSLPHCRILRIANDRNTSVRWLVRVASGNEAPWRMRVNLAFARRGECARFRVVLLSVSVWQRWLPCHASTSCLAFAFRRFSRLSVRLVLHGKTPSHFIIRRYNLPELTSERLLSVNRCRSHLAQCITQPDTWARLRSASCCTALRAEEQGVRIPRSPGATDAKL